MPFSGSNFLMLFGSIGKLWGGGIQLLTELAPLPPLVNGFPTIVLGLKAWPFNSESKLVHPREPSNAVYHGQNDPLVSDISIFTLTFEGARKRKTDLQGPSFLRIRPWTS